MIIAQLKQLKKSLIYRKNYPHSSIASGSYVGKETTLGINTKIGKNSSLSHSHIGDGVTIRESCSLYQSKIEKNITIYSHCSLSDVSIGKFSYIAQNSRLNLTQVGSFCSLGAELISGTGEHPADFISTNPVFFSTFKQCGVTFADKDYFEELKPITIGHDVWIGARVFIRDAVKIGNGAIVGAGAVVVKDVPDYAIVVGVPAKIIRFRFPDQVIQELLNIQWWNWSEEKLRSAQGYFVQKDIYSFIEWAHSHSESSYCQVLQR